MSTNKETLRTILERNAKRDNPINPVLLVENYVEDNDMTLTADDKAALKEHGLRPHRFMQFSDAQCEQFDDIESAIDHLLRVLLNKPDYLKDKEIDIPDFQKEGNNSYASDPFGLNYLELASMIATHLADAGYTVFMPSHEVDADGTERILDIY